LDEFEKKDDSKVSLFLQVFELKSNSDEKEKILYEEEYSVQTKYLDLTQDELMKDVLLHIAYGKALLVVDLWHRHEFTLL
jgi:hypothetical protein